MGLMNTVMLASNIIVPTLGGAVVDGFGWRWMYVIIAVSAALPAAVAILTHVTYPEYANENFFTIYDFGEFPLEMIAAMLFLNQEIGGLFHSQPSGIYLSTLFANLAIHVEARGPYRIPDRIARLLIDLRENLENRL